jgi:hypothetical protein
MTQTNDSTKPELPAPRSGAARFFGGPPLAVVAKLVLLSIVVGLILSVLGLDPRDLLGSLRRLVSHIWEMGFEIVEWVWGYLILGAAVVLPIWLIVRLVRAPQGR